MGRPDLDWKISLNSLVVGVTLNFLLIPVLGIYCAVIGTIAALLTDSILAVIFLKRILKIKIEVNMFIKVIFNIAISFAFVMAIENLLSHYVAGILFIGFYLLLSFITKIITIPEILKIFQIAVSG